MQDDGHIHVVTDGMNPVRGADAAAIAVASADENVEVWSCHLDAFGDGKCTAMNAVEPVNIHIMGKPAGAADAGDEHRVFGSQLVITTQPLHRGEDSVVAAPGTPPGKTALIVVEGVVLSL
jgi:hypothetical protein